MKLAVLAALVTLGLTAPPGVAGEADVVGVEAAAEGAGAWRFDVTLRHADSGWKHYADSWDVVVSDGTVLGTRTLYHPHETEQPFTRSLSGVRIPAGTARVTVRAHHKVHGLGGREVTVKLPR